MEVGIRLIRWSKIKSPLHMNETRHWRGVCLSSQLDEGTHEVQVCAINNQVRVCAVIGR